MEYVSHPRIVPNSIEKREYQDILVTLCQKENTLLVIPTALGKTIIALLAAIETLDTGKKIVMLAPTKPLVEQHYSSVTALTQNTKVGMMNGNMDFKTRISVMAENDFIISTPQVLENDLENGRYDLKKVGFMIYDEAHRAVGNYSYVNVAKYYRGKAIGTTASPSAYKGKVEEICRNLSMTDIRMRTELDADVAPYVHDIAVKEIRVKLPAEMLEVIKYLNEIMNYHLEMLRKFGFIGNVYPSVKHLLRIGESIQTRLGKGEKEPYLFRALVAQSACMKLIHAINLAETQGMTALRMYLIKMDKDSHDDKGGRSTKEIMNTDQFKKIQKIVFNTKIEHPKLSKTMSLVSKTINSHTSSKIMIFTQYRDTCELLVKKLATIQNVKVAKLIGQSKGGLKQKEQIELLDGFRSGEYNTLVATSVGEEGLDIADTDMVIFYEPVPSEIRTIQRRGRTGRKNDGEVYILITEGTRDESYEMSSKWKEETMKERLTKLNKTLDRRKKDSKQKKIGDY